MPGNWDSLPRDIRTRMLLEVACDEYPDREWSPKPGGVSRACRDSVHHCGASLSQALLGHCVCC